MDEEKIRYKYIHLSKLSKWMVYIYDFSPQNKSKHWTLNKNMHEEIFKGNFSMSENHVVIKTDGKWSVDKTKERA